MIVVIAERQSLKNDHTCDFCGDEDKPVVGRAYANRAYDHPRKHYLFSYCGECGARQAGKMAGLARLSSDAEQLAATTKEN